MDFKRPAGHKEVQKFTFACCSRARGKNATTHQFRNVSVATTESSSFRNLPALALFPRAPFLRSFYRWHSFARDVQTTTVQCYGGRGNVPSFRFRETRLIIPTAYRPPPPTRPSSHYAVIIISANGPPTCPAGSVTRFVGDSFHSSFCSESRCNATRGSRFFVPWRTATCDLHARILHQTVKTKFRDD